MPYVNEKFEVWCKQKLVTRLGSIMGSVSEVKLLSRKSTMNRRSSGTDALLKQWTIAHDTNSSKAEAKGAGFT
jgi:hypothetical protein